MKFIIFDNYYFIRRFDCRRILLNYTADKIQAIAIGISIQMLTL